MKQQLLLACFILMIFSQISSPTKAQVAASDSLALVDFYNNTGGATWYTHTNWLTGKPVSSWYGVTVSTGRVTKIALFSNKITGSFPSSFGNLTELTYLSMGSNYLSHIPTSFSQLSKLTYVDLEYNKITDTIAVFGSLPSLTHLNLSANLLTGPIPAEYSNLTNLTYLDLSYATLSGGIPDFVYRFTHLDTLILFNDQLGGSISERIGNLGNMSYLALAANNLTGSIPGNIGKLKKLTYLDLRSNGLTGQIPAPLGRCFKMRLMNLSSNQLSGPIPNTLGNLSVATSIYLDHNQLGGLFSPGLFHLQNLTYFDVSYNKLTLAQNFTADAQYPKLIFKLNDNRFTFDGLEYMASHIGLPTYYPQDSITIHQHGNELAVSAGGTLSNNTYQWFSTSGNSVTITGDSTFTPAASGDYYAVVTNSIATNLKLYTKLFTYTKSSLAAQEKLSPVIVVSPNPVRDMLTVRNLNEKSDAKITIADMSGYVWVKAISRQQSALRLDASRLKAGNYLVNVNDGKEVKTVQFVKE